VAIKVTSSSLARSLDGFPAALPCLVDATHRYHVDEVVGLAHLGRRVDRVAILFDRSASVVPPASASTAPERRMSANWRCSSLPNTAARTSRKSRSIFDVYGCGSQRRPPFGPGSLPGAAEDRRVVEEVDAERTTIDKTSRLPKPAMLMRGQNASSRLRPPFRTVPRCH
jgi:hypothetical protein